MSDPIADAFLDVATIAQVVTGPSAMVTSRTGQQIKSLAKLQDDALAVMSTFNPRGAWVTATAYAVRDVVTNGGVVYAIAIAHTSGTFATDLAAGKLYILQGVVAADLANQTDTSKGAALIGYNGGTMKSWADAQRGAWNAPNFPRNAVLCLIGDSITVKGSYFTGAEPVLFGAGGPFEGWTVYNSASNGSYLNDWYNSIAGGATGAAPLNSDDSTRNLWRLVNADPDEIIIMLGTNDARKRLANGGLYANDAALQAGLTSQMKAVLDFLLTKTSARIDLQIPVPLTYISGSVSGFCDFADANDAYNRNVAIRTAYRSFRNYSPRVMVTDMHKAMFPAGTADSALRWDSLATSVDPEGTGTVIKVDELHWIGAGETRRAQVMAKRRNPSLPKDTSFFKKPSVTFQQASIYDLVRAVVKGVGAGYVDIYANTIEMVFGQLSKLNSTGPGLDRMQRASDLYLSGYQNQLRRMLRAKSFTIFDGTTAFATTPTTIAYNAVDTILDYWRVSFSGGATPGLTPGAIVDIYVTNINNLAPQPALYDGVQLYLAGAANQARRTIPAMNGMLPFNVNNIQACRQAGTDIATFGVYISNVWNGSFDATDPTYDASAPGLKMGVIDLPANYLMQSGWTPTTLGTALGGAIPAHGYPNVSIYVVKESGTIGDWATITMKSA